MLLPKKINIKPQVLIFFGNTLHT